MTLHPTDVARADEFIEKHVGKLASPPDTMERVRALGPLVSHEFQVAGFDMFLRRIQCNSTYVGCVLYFILGAGARVGRSGGGFGHRRIRLGGHYRLGYLQSEDQCARVHVCFSEGPFNAV